MLLRIRFFSSQRVRDLHFWHRIAESRTRLEQNLVALGYGPLGAGGRPALSGH